MGKICRPNKVLRALWLVHASGHLERDVFRCLGVLRVKSEREAISFATHPRFDVIRRDFIPFETFCLNHLTIVTKGILDSVRWCGELQGAIGQCDCAHLLPWAMSWERPKGSAKQHNERAH